MKDNQELQWEFRTPPFGVWRVLCQDCYGALRNPSVELRIARRPLPSQAPEERELDPKSPEATSRFIAKQADQIHTLTRERDEARERAATLHVVWKSRAESAEARVKELEQKLADGTSITLSQTMGKLRSMIEERDDALNRGRKLQEEFDALEEKLATAHTPTWIPVSTPPTEKDGDTFGRIVGLLSDGELVITRTGTWMTTYPTLTKWLTLPPSTQTEEETAESLLKRVFDDVNVVNNRLWRSATELVLQASRKGVQS